MQAKKMELKKTTVVCFTIFWLVTISNAKLAEECTEDKCKIENNCRCSSSQCPIDVSTIPQLIALTFDEAVTAQVYNDYWSPLLLNRLNPDGVPIGTTFFVPHENTDYQKVNDLYNYGFEIAVNSITRNSDQEYWRNATEDTLKQEFAGQRTIISKFANIPAQDIVGVRVPQLQLAGNFSIAAYLNSNFLYDSSWPTKPNKPLYPYTFDYLSTQECDLGFYCPNEEFKGFWESPIIDLNGDSGVPCSTLAACINSTNPTEQHITDWLYKEITSVRDSTRIPLTLVVESQWFGRYPDGISFKALQKVMDKLAELKDVFFVSQKQLIDWMKNPVPTSSFKTEFDDTRAASCPFYSQNSCEYKTTTGSRYMATCMRCPNSYPWLNNPEGN